ncbi:hypothetical protein [Azospirillum sp. B21]|uniref:hypothetical protein n=1 Tax=Azospirillum sp. B21 TaxID=2607496 RepID=UPI00165FFF9B|nr:hypothetical protein [Azospirillum sp. B21]
MKIRTLNSVKFQGTLHPPGTELDVPNDVAKPLLEAKSAEKVLVEPKASAPAPAKD